MNYSDNISPLEQQINELQSSLKEIKGITQDCHKNYVEDQEDQANRCMEYRNTLSKVLYNI